eukprot:755870-Hanusia_phi.AAC.3
MSYPSCFYRKSNLSDVIVTHLQAVRSPPSDDYGLYEDIISSPRRCSHTPRRSSALPILDTIDVFPGTSMVEKTLWQV